MENFFVEIIGALWQVLGAVLKALSPLIIGLVLAYLMNPLVEWIRFRLVRQRAELLGTSSPRGRTGAIIVGYVAVLLLLFLIVYAFVVLILGALPSEGLYETGQRVYDYFAVSYENISDFVGSFLPEEFYLEGYSLGSIVSSWVDENLSIDSLLSLVGGLASSLLAIFVGLIASIYLLKDKEFFLGLWQRFLAMVLGQRSHGVINEIFGEINQVLMTFIKGALVDSLIVALLSSLVLSAIQLRYAVIIGILGGILNIIPYFGPFFGMIPAFLVGWNTAGPAYGALAAAVLFGVQQVDSNYIYPKVVGTSIGLHPFFVLLSVSVFGYFCGIWGMLLAVPIAGVVQVLVRRWAERA